MSYLDDLKKKGQQFVQNVQNAANTATNVYNAAKQGVQNVYNAATGNTQQPVTPQAQIPNTNPSPASQPQNPQPEINWAAEYDKAMAPQTTPTTSAQPGGQAAQPPTSAAAQSALGEGAGQWQAELDNVMAQIMGKGKFDYNMNGDAMYQQYADIYQNQANLGMQNAMAQAAALTGGYGSSYGQMVGQQAYAQQMQGLNDIGLELYDRAYAQDMAERSQLMDQYNMLAAREEQAYNRGIDERNFEYQQGRDEVADNQWQQSFDYNKYLDELNQSNFDKQFEYQQSRDNVSDSQWKAELDRMLANDEISQQQWQAEMDRALANDATANEQWQAGMDWQAEEFDKLYGEGGYYTTEAQKDREHQASQNQLNREHDVTMQNDQQSHQKEILKDEQAYNTSERLASQGYNDTVREDDQAHDKEMQNDSQTHQSEMATKQHDWQVEEWDKMYGPEGYMTKKDKQEQKNWQDEFDREGEWYDAAQEASKTTTTYAGNSNYIGNDTEVPKQLAGVDGLTTTNTNLFDDNGNFKQAAVVEGSAKNIDGSAAAPKAGVGTMTYNIGGKEIKVQTGTSPYTNTVNPDAKKGVMANGYQPNNIGGDPLTETDWEYPVNGQWVPTYTKPDGTEYAYDAANNTYILVPPELRGGSSSTDKNLSGKVNPNFSYAYK